MNLFYLFLGVIFGFIYYKVARMLVREGRVFYIENDIEKDTKLMYNLYMVSFYLIAILWPILFIIGLIYKNLKVYNPISQPIFLCELETFFSVPLN